MRAVECGLFIQSKLAEYDSQQVRYYECPPHVCGVTWLAQGFTLSLHVGIGAGTVTFLNVGGIDSAWENLVCGDAVEQLRTCVDLSSSGEVCVSGVCWRLISDVAEGCPRGDHGDWLVTRVQETRGAWALQSEAIAVPTIAEGALRCFVPQLVQVLLDAPEDMWMNELRTATVLFVKLNR